MEEIFIKKYWSEDDIIFFIHFSNSVAVRQIEISDGNKILLSQDNPFFNESMLYDQSIEDLELSETDFISKEEFEKVWKV
ncbi:MAG: hypothetical protein J7574_09095 [Flavobacterium sp.]|uniref:hypothetical protein n=1 Tax=Flavobacterium sp. TaxID=239 RepID=UPI001B25CE45|nr:hypothetical protein [Flavobacterium sp.]MBO9584301.1 hypothetical protein [Flavobacterium sp.]